jgi:hypothetical protein
MKSDVLALSDETWIEMEASDGVICSDAAGRPYDVGAANLAAAIGLRGAEGLDIPNALDWLDSSAKQVHLETLRHAYQFRDHPEDFENSPAYFCMLVMVTVLRQQFGVRYNPARIRDPSFQDPNCFEPDFSDSRDLFIHGIIGGPGGTCASMPVLYVAVGRRLRYPLKLVQAKGHLFVRWDDAGGTAWSPGAQFNVEATCEGLWCPPDEHYMTWPVPMNQNDLAAGIYLRPLGFKEEVAMFRSTRATCLWENGRYGDALRECHLAVALAPHHQPYSWQIMDFYRRYRERMLGKAAYEIAAVGLTTHEELSLQHNILRGHIELLRRGKPGYDLAAFGICATRLPGQDAVTAPDRLDARPGSGATISTSMDGFQSAPVRSALEQIARAKRQTDFNRENRARLQRGLPGLNPTEYLGKE